jgi:hypothetical protein
MTKPKTKWIEGTALFYRIVQGKNFFGGPRNIMIKAPVSEAKAKAACEKFFAPDITHALVFLGPTVYVFENPFRSTL